MITSILDHIAALPEPVRQACAQIFHMDLAIGASIPPPEMVPWIERQFGASTDVREQTIVTIVNRFTLEGAIFNPLRARRPIDRGGGEQALEARIAERLADRDIFCDPWKTTTADTFGRIRGRFCVTAANIAKYAGWHGLVIFDEPHPLRFGSEQIQDYLDVAFRWIAAAHAADDQAIYPIITWNCLPKSGATVMHGHMQVALKRGMPYGAIERWRRATIDYRQGSDANYIDDLYAIHAALGLALPHPSEVRAFAHLTPLRDREIVLLTEPSTRGVALQPPAHWALFATTIAETIQRLIERLGMRAFNLAILLPPLTITAEDWRTMPVIARLVDRGDALAVSNDWGAIEMFATGCVVSDPFMVAGALT